MTHQTDSLAQQARRRFLQGAAAVTGAAVTGAWLDAPLAATETPASPVTPSKRWGLLIDTRHCKDCNECVTACQHEHGWHSHSHPQVDAHWIRKVTVRDKQTGHENSLPLMCQHCEHPPCVDVCPTGASFKRADGIVLVDKHICIGCRYCMMACPYKARSFVHEKITGQKSHSPRGKGTVESCNLCVHKVDKGEQPACVTACQATGKNAIVFGDLNDPNSAIAQKLKAESSLALRADMRLNPGVRYQGM